MPTECSPTLFEFAPVQSHAVVATFDGGTIRSDARCQAAREVSSASRWQLWWCIASWRPPHDIRFGLTQLQRYPSTAGTPRQRLGVVQHCFGIRWWTSGEGSRGDGTCQPPDHLKPEAGALGAGAIVDRDATVVSFALRPIAPSRARVSAGASEF